MRRVVLWTATVGAALSLSTTLYGDAPGIVTSRIEIESDGWKLIGNLTKPESDQAIPAVLLLNQAAGFDKHRRGLFNLLIDYDVDLNTQHPDGAVSDSTNTPLHGVARKGDVTAVRLLLRNGANPEVRNREGLRSIDLRKNKQVRALLKE